VQHQAVAGVPADAVHALGAVALGAGRLEHLVRLVAADLYAHPGKKRTSDLIKHIRRCGLEPSLPPHTTTTGSDLVEWVDAIREALEERDEVIHSVSAHTFGSGPHLIHLRTQRRRPADAVAFGQLSSRLFKLSATGWQLVKGLRQSPRPGVFIANAVVDEQWIPICDTDIGGIGMARPTDDELDLWWNTLGPFPRLTANPT
jgi:hypothetical protein